MSDFYRYYIEDGILPDSLVPLDTIRKEISSLFKINSLGFNTTFNVYFSNSKSEIFELFKNLYNKEQLEISDITGFKDFLDKNSGKELLGKFILKDFDCTKCEDFIKKFDGHLENIEDIQCSFFFTYIYFCTIDGIITFLENSYIGGFKDDYLVKELLIEKYKSLKKLLSEKYSSLRELFDEEAKKN